MALIISHLGRRRAGASALRDAYQKQSFRPFLYLLQMQEQSAGDTAQSTYGIRLESHVHILLDYIHARYSERITLEELANAAAISKTETMRCFKRIIGKFPMRYLKNTDCGKLHTCCRTRSDWFGRSAKTAVLRIVAISLNLSGRCTGRHRQSTAGRTSRFDAGTAK